MNRDRFILAIDQGTTNTKAILVDAGGASVAEASQPVTVRLPQPERPADAVPVRYPRMPSAAQQLDRPVRTGCSLRGRVDRRRLGSPGRHRRLTPLDRPVWTPDDPCRARVTD
jgi:hypothetical protein